MSFTEEKYGEVLITTVHLERATLVEAENFKPFITKLIEDGERKIIVDLSDCDFIDSTFLGVLVNGLKKLKRRNGDLFLVGFKPAVSAMFELTRMDRVFRYFSSTQDAIFEFNNS